MYFQVHVPNLRYSCPGLLNLELINLVGARGGVRLCVWLLSHTSHSYNGLCSPAARPRD
eukprot:SAG31_NODE_25770_length_454_cov_1.600000_1_plen_58_part_10